jgi:hypothetical protein
MSVLGTKAHVQNAKSPPEKLFLIWMTSDCLRFCEGPEPADGIQLLRKLLLPPAALSAAFG